MKSLTLGWLSVFFLACNVRSEEYEAISQLWAEAIDKSDVSAIASLSMRYDINQPLEGKAKRWATMTPLGYAAFILNTESVNVLLARGATKDGKDELGFRAIDRVNSRSGIEKERIRNVKLALEKDGEPSEEEALALVVDSLLHEALGERKIKSIKINGKEPAPRVARMLNMAGIEEKGFEITMSWNFKPSLVEFRLDGTLSFLDGFTISGSLVPDSGYWVLKSIERSEG